MGVDSWGGPYLACPAPGECCCHHDGAEHNGSFSQRPPRLKAPSLRTHSAHELAATVGYFAPAPGSTVVSPLPHILPCPKLFSPGHEVRVSSCALNRKVGPEMSGAEAAWLVA